MRAAATYAAIGVLTVLLIGLSTAFIVFTLPG